MYKGGDAHLKIMVLRAVVDMLAEEERRGQTLAATIGASGNDLCGRRKYTEMVEETNPDDAPDGGGTLTTTNPSRARRTPVYRVTSIPLDTYQSTVLDPKCKTKPCAAYDWWGCCWAGLWAII